MRWLLLLSVTAAALGAELGTGGARLTLWTPGHLDALHAALRAGTPLHAELRAVPRHARNAKAPAPARLSLWVPSGQEELAAREWQDESGDDRSPVVVREADDDDALLDSESESVPMMSPAWLRHWVQRSASADTAPGAHLRHRRSAPAGATKAGGDEGATGGAEKPATTAQTAQQVKAARSHQFVTTRGEKDQPPVVREVEPVAGHDKHSRPAAGAPQDQGPGAHASPTAAGSSRIGAARDALGLRSNEIPQGPRYSSIYEAESMRHASDQRQYAADSYGGHDAYSASYGSSYGNQDYGNRHYGSPSYNNPTYMPWGRNAQTPTAAPRRIIYYASLPDPAPQPIPGASRVPHEYRGPPYDVNGAYSADSRYPAYYDGRSPADNPYRSRFRPQAPRYTIIDAEPPSPVLGAYRSTAAPSAFRDRPASPSPASFPQPYRLGPPTTDAAGPQAASPIQYTQYDYNGIGGLPPQLPTDPMSTSGARTANSAALIESKPGSVQVPLNSDDPYRGFNPRQPAPWSMQVGTRLTVKDDGYGGVGSGALPPAARRFYVTSQQQPGFPSGPGAVSGSARFPRPLDRSEARKRLFR